MSRNLTSVFLFSPLNASANFLFQPQMEKDFDTNVRVGFFPTTSSHQGKTPLSLIHNFTSHVHLLFLCFKFIYCWSAE